MQQISRTRKHLYIFQIYSVCSVVLVSGILVMLIFSQRSWHCVLYFLEIIWCLSCTSQLPTKPNFRNIIYFSHWHILTSIDNQIKMSCEHVFELRFCKMQGQETPRSSSMFSHTIAREIFTNLKYFDNCLVQHSTPNWITTTRLLCELWCLIPYLNYLHRIHLSNHLKLQCKTPHWG